MNHYLVHQFVSPYYNRRNDVWVDQYEFPIAVTEKAFKVKEVYGNKDLIVGYRLSPEEAESPGITMEIAEGLVDKISHMPIDYIHTSMMDTHAAAHESKYTEQERLPLIHKWINGCMLLIGISSISTADDALDTIENVGVDLVTIDKELLLDYQFVERIKDGREDEVISYFGPEREDNRHSTLNLWHQFNEGSYSLPRKDK